MMRSLLALGACHLVLAGNKANCIQNTGGTCSVSSCLAWRGNTKCDTLRCFCDGGTCAGTDGSCHASTHADVPYTRIATKAGANTYELQNSRWPNYFIYVTALGELKLSTDHDGETSLYYISRTPSDKGEPNALPTAQSYVVLSKKWPDAAVQTLLQQGEYVPTCHNVDGSLGGLGADPSILDVSLTFTRAPEDVQLAEMKAQNKVLVMISNPRYPNYFFYTGKTSWSVKTWENDPGAGGYWYIKTRDSVPVPMSVQSKMFNYAGPRCGSFCGEVSSEAHSTRSISVAVLVAVLAAVGWSTA